MKRKLFKRLVEIVFTAMERGLYAVSGWYFCLIAYHCFSSVATTTGWLVLAHFFGGVVAAAAALGVGLALGVCKPFAFRKKENKNTTYEELEQDDEYNIALNG